MLEQEVDFDKIAILTPSFLTLSPSNFQNLPLPSVEERKSSDDHSAKPPAPSGNQSKPPAPPGNQSKPRKAKKQRQSTVEPQLEATPSPQTLQTPISLFTTSSDADRRRSRHAVDLSLVSLSSHHVAGGDSRPVDESAFQGPLRLEPLVNRPRPPPMAVARGNDLPMAMGNDAEVRTVLGKQKKKKKHQLKHQKEEWRLFIFISRERKWGTLKSAGNPRCAVSAESHSICTDRRRPGPAAALQVSPTSDTCQSPF